MGGDDHRGAQPVQFDEQPIDPQRHLMIDIAGRLVSQQDLGTANDRAGYGQTLLLATGQGRGQGGHVIAKPDPGQQFGDVVAILGWLVASNPQRQGGVVEGREVVQQQQILEHHADPPAHGGQIAGRHAGDVLAEQPHLTGRGLGGQVDQLEQRAFAGAGGSRDEVERPARQRQRDPAEDLRAAPIAHRDVVEAEDFVRDCGIGHVGAGFLDKTGFWTRAPKSATSA